MGDRGLVLRFGDVPERRVVAHERQVHVVGLVAERIVRLVEQGRVEEGEVRYDTVLEAVTFNAAVDVDDVVGRLLRVVAGEHLHLDLRAIVEPLVGARVGVKCRLLAGIGDRQVVAVALCIDGNLDGSVVDGQHLGEVVVVHPRAVQR